MSNLSIEERFTLDATPERVWAYLTDPARMVGCLPGAELTGQEDERTHVGTVRVKVGSMTLTYGGTVVFEEVDEEHRSVRLVGKGREKTGSGTATMTMVSRVAEAEGGGAEVTVDADVRVTGKIVRFGRGMIQSVSAEIFQTFTTRFAEMIAAEDSGPDGDVGVSAAQNTRNGSVEPSPASPGAQSEDSIALLPLLFRAFRRWLSGLFGRR